MGRAVMDLGLGPADLRIAALALSGVVGILAAYVTLELARRVRVVPTPVGLRWLGGAALSLGTGIWSLHVIGVAAAIAAVPARLSPAGGPRRLARRRRCSRWSGSARSADA